MSEIPHHPEQPPHAPRQRPPASEETPELLEEPFETSIDCEDSEAGPGGVRIDVPGGRLVGRWQDPEAPPGVAKLDDLAVGDARKGKGTHLMRAFAREAVARGATMLRSTIVSPQAMRNRVRIFGDHNLIFVERRPDGMEWVLPMTADQAIQSMQRAESFAEYWDDEEEMWPDDFEPGIATHVDLMSPSVRIRIGLPPMAGSVEPGPGTSPQATGESVGRAGPSVEGVRSEIMDSVELVRSIGDVVLGSSVTLRGVLLRLQAALQQTEAAAALPTELRQALESAGATVEQLNFAIEELRRYDRDISQ